MKNLKLSVKGVLFIVCAAFFNTGLFAQLKPIAHKVQSYVNSGLTPYELSPFTEDKTSANLTEISKVVSSSVILNIDEITLNNIMVARPVFVYMSIPSVNGGFMKLLLYQESIFTPDFSVVTPSGGSSEFNADDMLFYRGITEDDNSSLAAISIYKNEVMGTIANDEGNFVLGKLKNDVSNHHIFYNDKNLLIKNNTSCFTDDKEADLPGTPGNRNQSPQSACIRFYWEADNDIYTDKGSVANTTAYLSGLFNQSAVIFTNDNIPVSLSQVFVWNTADPYNSTSTFGFLSQFQSYRNSFPGDIGHLLGYQGGGGVAAGFNGLCAANPDQSQCYSGIMGSYANVPLYSWSIEVVTHEQGHLLGSRHTHACVWNGNNTAIDGCGPSAGYGYEGNCSGAVIPSNGGTIMSYCHLTSAGINFANGFGPQPAAAILVKYNAAACLTNCSGVFCPSPQNLVSQNITTTTADLQWDTALNAQGYDIQYRVQGTSTWSSVTSPANSLLLTGLTPGTSYEWRVSTDCGASTSSFSSFSFFVTVPLFCNAPVNLLNMNISSSSCKVTWGAVGGAVSYIVYYRETGVGSWLTTTSLTNECSIYGLSPLTSYEWYVITQCSGGGASGNSLTINFTTVSSPAPAACYPFTGNAQDVSGNNHHGLVSGAQLTYDRFGNAGRAYVFNGVSDQILIPAYNTISPSGNEVAVSFWAISYQFKSQSAIMLFPDDPYDRFSIHINYSHNGVPATFWDYGSISGGGRLYILPDPYVSQWNHYVFMSSTVQDSMWMFRNGVLVAWDNTSDQLVNRNKELCIGGGMASGNSPFYFSGAIDDVVIYTEILSRSEINTLFQQNTPCIVTSVSETEQPVDFNVYPNPADGNIFISGFGAGNISYELMDVSGKVIFSGDNSGMRKIEINAGGLNAGMYLLKIKNHNGVAVKRIVVK